MQINTIDQQVRAELVMAWLDINLEDFIEKLSAMSGAEIIEIDPTNDRLVANWIQMLKEEVDPQIGMQALAQMSDSYLASLVKVFGV